MVEKICLDKSKKAFFLRDDGEELVISTSEGLCSISEIGVLIIRGLNANTSIKEIVETISATYDVSTTELKTDITSFIYDLKEIDILSEQATQKFCEEINDI